MLWRRFANHVRTGHASPGFAWRRKAERSPAVWLFSGHMVDRAGRRSPRFPEEFVGVADRAIRAKLDALGAQAGDTALCGGACGGDLLFAEACLEIGMDLQVLLHDSREVVLEESVAFAGPSWRDRFDQVTAHPRCTVTVMAPAGTADRFVRANQWRLEVAVRAADGGPIQLIALWDGRPGDRPGGTEHMCALVEAAGGAVHLLPARRLAQWRAAEVLGPGSPAISADEALALVAHLKRERQFEFGHAVLARALEDPAATPAQLTTLRQQRALCLYKDPDLAGEYALPLALRALAGPDGGGLDEEPDKETLGMAGAIHKRWWEINGERSHLERACAVYERGYRQELAQRERDPGAPIDWYAGINTAYVRTLLADATADAASAEAHHAAAASTRAAIATDLEAQLSGVSLGQGDWWRLATIVEALFGLGRFDEAETWLASFPDFTLLPGWQLESTARQLAVVAELWRRREQQRDGPASLDAPARILRKFGLDLAAANLGRVGLALSGGGFRAAFFQVGLLASLAEQDLLRHVEVLSCVSGGSILGAYYYLELRQLLQTKADSAITRDDYIAIVKRIEARFLKGVQTDIRGAIFRRALLPPTRFAHRTEFAAELFEQRLYSRVQDGGGASPRLLRDLVVQPMTDQGYRDRGFNPKVDNWRRRAKVPMLVINATTLNSGHNWQFTATWMGEPPIHPAERLDANPRLRRVYLAEARPPHNAVRLGTAVAASACVPGVFAPVALPGLFPGHTAQLVDGGVHDNQGIGALLREDCTILILSDGSGQMGMTLGRPSNPIGVMQRSSSVMGFEMRRRWFRELSVLEKARRGHRRLLVHLKLGLPFEDIEPATSGATTPSTVPGGEGSGATPVALAPPGLPHDLQGALAQLRTDLDSFSDDEAHALMLSGYRMTERSLSALGFGPGDPAIRPAWRFLRLAAAVDNPDSRAYRKLLANLEAGRIGFLRGARQLLARLRGASN